MFQLTLDWLRSSCLTKTVDLEVYWKQISFFTRSCHKPRDSITKLTLWSRDTLSLCFSCRRRVFVTLSSDEEDGIVYCQLHSSLSLPRTGS